MAATEERNDYPKDTKKVALGQDVSLYENSIGKGQDILALHDLNPAFDGKM